VNEADTDQQITESIPVLQPVAPVQESAFSSSAGAVEPRSSERPEKAVAAAFAGGLLFAKLLRRVRS
jgi:hypothetical protein